MKISFLILGLSCFLLAAGYVQAQEYDLVRKCGSTVYNIKLNIYYEDDDAMTYSEDKMNAVLNIEKVTGGVTRNIFRDSLHCNSFIADDMDVNRDGIKDLLLFQYSGARSNATYYLFLIDSTSMTRVAGFEQLTNPNMDGNIITSLALYGDNTYYQFYKLVNNRLIDLHSPLHINLDDTVSYSKTINKLKKRK